MNRKKFIKHCVFACLSTSTALAILQSCVTHKSILGEIEGSDLSIPISSFLNKNSEDSYQKYVIVEHSLFKYPIYVFRFSENEYKATLMQCTHQGAELQAFGDVLQCPAHGSEFDNKGRVQNGPASEDLRSFPVRIVNNHLKISLKNV